MTVQAPDPAGQDARRQAAAHGGDVEHPHRLLVQIQPRRPVGDHFAGEGDLLQAHQIGEDRGEEHDRDGRPFLAGREQVRHQMPAEIPAQIGPHQIDDDVGSPPGDPLFHGEDGDEAGEDHQADQQVRPESRARIRYDSFPLHAGQRYG